MTRKLTLAALALALVAGAGWFAMQPSPLPADPLFSASAQEAEVDTSRVIEMQIGNAEAPVTVIEYASYTCPHCATFHATTFQQLKTNYIDTGKINFIYREVYFDRFGLWAAAVARCAGPERYFGVSGLIYEKQRDWIGDGAPEGIAERLKTIGKTAGMTEEQVDGCLRDAGMLQSMVAVYQENATADGIESTPSFVINGEKYSNMSFEDFAKILDEKLGG